MMRDVVQDWLLVRTKFRIMPYTIKWTDEMVSYLLENQEKSSWELGRHLGVSDAAVRSQFKRLGIGRSFHKQGYEWTPEKDAYLKEHWPDDAGCDIAEALGTCYGTVKKRADELGLRKSKDYNTYKFHNRWCKDYKHSIRKVA